MRIKDYIIEPLHDFVLVKRRSKKDKTEGGLYMPSSSVGHQMLADVLAVGPGRDDSLTVKEGDVVVLDTIAGFPIEIAGEKVTVVREAEIVAIVREID